MATSDEGSEGRSQTARDQGSELRRAATQQGADLTGTVKDQAATVTHEAVAEARQVVQRAKDGLHEQANTRAAEASDAIRRMGRQAQALADGRPEEAGAAGQYVRQAASKLDEVATRIEAEGFDGVTQDLVGFARRRPGAFLLGAGVAGFVVGRVMRGARADQAATGPSPATLAPARASAPLAGASSTGGSILVPPTSGPGTRA